MITEPSKELNGYTFLVGGKHPQVDLGQAKTHGVLPISQWRYFCCRSKINLNITKEIDAQAYATSSARPFELASMGCCMVTDSYNGIEEWFELGKEAFMANNAKEAKEIYTTLLSSEDLRRKTGEVARQRVLKEHTMLHRAKHLVNIVKILKGSDL
jgi:spore maturation protein CgeB